jgi:hypothetical protein
MNRILTLALVTVAFGCNRGQNANAPEPPNMTPSGARRTDNMTPAQKAAHRVPVLTRTLSQQELDQLGKYMNQYQAEHNKYPTTMAELKELDVPRDLPKVAQAVESGDLVLTGGTNGILAYEAVTLEDKGNVLTTGGVLQMTADELRKKLGR